MPLNSNTNLHTHKHTLDLLSSSQGSCGLHSLLQWLLGQGVCQIRPQGFCKAKLDFQSTGRRDEWARGKEEHREWGGMKLQTTCTSDKAAHINVSVWEKVSMEMSISTQREESWELGGEKVRQKCRQEREKKLNPLKESSCTQNTSGWGEQREWINELSMKEYSHRLQ